MEFKRVFAVYSDLHVGSAFALFPDNYVTTKGNKIFLNSGQQKIYQFWQKGLNICKKFKVDTILLDGDLVQGLHKKKMGEGNIIAELDEQKRAAIELLKPLCKGRKVIGVSGTDYHGSIDTKVECDIIQAVGGQYMGYVFNADIEGTNRSINMLHGSGGSVIYRETSAGREVLFFHEAATLGKLDKYDIFVRAHNHMFLHIHKPKTHYLINPCWQALVPDQYTTRNYAKWSPDIGFSIITIDTSNRIGVMHFLLDTPIHVMDFKRKV